VIGQFLNNYSSQEETVAQFNVRAPNVFVRYFFIAGFEAVRVEFGPQFTTNRVAF